MFYFLLPKMTNRRAFSNKKNIKKNYVIKKYKLELEWMLRHVYISVFLYEWIEYKKRLCNTVLIDAVRRASHYTICKDFKHIPVYVRLKYHIWKKLNYRTLNIKKYSKLNKHWPFYYIYPMINYTRRYTILSCKIIVEMSNWHQTNYILIYICKKKLND